MSNKALSRRDFIKLASAGALGGYLSLTGVSRAMGGMGGGMGGWWGSGVIDPPPGSPLIEPAALALTVSAPGVVEGAVTAAATRLALGGASADLLTYNGHYPGPLVRVKRGEKLRLRLTNGLPASAQQNALGFGRNLTNLHTHGWHVSPKDPADNVMRHLKPGESWTYEYDLGKQPAGTLGWYHPHVHGLVAEQLWAGLAGPLLVEDPSTLLSGFETHVLVLKDMTLNGGAPSPYAYPMDYMRGKEGAIVTVNGQVNPVLQARPGQVERLRILNASTARFYKLNLEGHKLALIGTDGGLLDKPYLRSTILLAPGERVDVLLKATSTAGSYRLLSLPYSRGGMMGGGMMGGMGSAQVTLLTVVVQGTATSDALPPAVNTQARRLTPDLSRLPHRRFVLSMGMARGYINGHDYDVSPYRVTSKLAPNRALYEVWTIVNRSGMDHPWHQHVNHAQILSINGGDPAYASLYTRSPAWKDTVIVPRMGSVTQLVRIRDWAGSGMFHCHIVEHEDIGMLGEWNIHAAM